MIQQTSQQLTLDDHTWLAVDQFAKPGVRPQLLLVAGLGAPAQFWPDFFCLKLVDLGFNVARFSNRDTGASSRHTKPYSINQMVDDVLTVKGSLLQPVHLVGHSLGGFMVQMAACRDVDLASITVISSGCTVDTDVKNTLGINHPSVGQTRELMAHVPSGDFERDLPGWLDHWRMLNGRTEFDPELAGEYTKALYQHGARSPGSNINQMYAYTTVPKNLYLQIAQLNLPVFVMHGDADPLLYLSEGEAIARLVPNSRFTRLVDAGHLFFNRTIWLEIANQIAENLSGDSE